MKTLKEAKVGDKLVTRSGLLSFMEMGLLDAEWWIWDLPKVCRCMFVRSHLSQTRLSSLFVGMNFLCAKRFGNGWNWVRPNGFWRRKSYFFGHKLAVANVKEREITWICALLLRVTQTVGKQPYLTRWPVPISLSEIGLALRLKKRRKIEKTLRSGYYRSSGIYSLSPYTLEEVVARNYLITERPDAILNIIDGTNLERNLYLTTQITELGVPAIEQVKTARL